MSQCKFITCFILIIFFTGCTKITVSDEFYPGIVLIKANSDYPNGLIQALDVFSTEEGIEASSRAIIYEYHSTKPVVALDLKDTVYFKIKTCEKSNLMMADQIYKITNFNINNHIRPSRGSKYASMEQIYTAKNHYKINLHLADQHREGPKHRKKTLRPPKILLSLTDPAGNSNYKTVDLMDPDNPLAPPVPAIIYDPNNVDTGPENIYFLSIRENVSFPSYPSRQVFNVSETHDHIIE